MSLDVRTLVIVHFLVSLTLAVLMVAFWRSHRTTPGLGHWTLGTALLGAAFLAASLRGMIPDSLSIIGANISGLISIIAFWNGIRLFDGRRTLWGEALLATTVVVVVDADRRLDDVARSSSSWAAAHEVQHIVPPPNRRCRLRRRGRDADECPLLCRRRPSQSSMTLQVRCRHRPPNRFLGPSRDDPSGGPAACHGLLSIFCLRSRRSVGRNTYFTYSHVGFLARRVFFGNRKF